MGARPREFWELVGNTTELNVHWSKDCPEPEKQNRKLYGDERAYGLRSCPFLFSLTYTHSFILFFIVCIFFNKNLKDTFSYLNLESLFPSLILPFLYQHIQC